MNTIKRKSSAVWSAALAASIFVSGCRPDKVPEEVEARVNTPIPASTIQPHNCKLGKIDKGAFHYLTEGAINDGIQSCTYQEFPIPLADLCESRTKVNGNPGELLDYGTLVKIGWEERGADTLVKASILCIYDTNNDGEPDQREELEFFDQVIR